MQACENVARTAASGAAGRVSDHAVSVAGGVPIACTPVRAEQTVRLELPGGWAEQISDEDLLLAFAEARRRA